MKVLLTGANGFVAPYLSRELTQFGHQVFLTGREASSNNQQHPYFTADLTDEKQVRDVIGWSRPDAVVHLAGISHVTSSELERADLITAVNIGSTSNICRSLQNQAHSSILLFISTGLVYQPIDHEDFLGFDESSPVGPVNDYGWSKLAAEAIARIYNGSRIKVYIARPFNHIGPGQDLRFVTPSLAKRILEAHDHTQIQVGNLEAKRDFTDVRDIVRAYRLILELQPEPRTLVLGSGQARPVSDIFKFFLEYSGKHLKHKCTEDLLRREQSIVFGNAALARRVLGWFPEISLQQTLQEVYESIAKGLSTHN